MKIKTIPANIDDLATIPHSKHINPPRQSMLLRLLLKLLSIGELKKTKFTLEKTEKAESVIKSGPVLYLMNHSSFIDLKIAASIIFPRQFHIVCTSDGFVGKEKLMRRLGCIPTRKFLTDVNLVRDMLYVVKNYKSSVLMYPEASYSFDGTATPLPAGLSKCIKIMNIPVVMIKTEGAFTLDPLYNNLQKRNVTVQANMDCILTVDDIARLSNEEINVILKENFTFDQFRLQKQKNVLVKENFRADGLNRVLYKCPHCMVEGKMLGKGITVKCQNCFNEYELREDGTLHNTVGESKFEFVSDWYLWEREEVKNDIVNGKYGLDLPVSIGAMIDFKAIYMIGDGRLIHDISGFNLYDNNGSQLMHLPPKLSYSLYADYFWYEIGDMICIGNCEILFYCFPKIEGDYVAKARLATEELYKMLK